MEEDILNSFELAEAQLCDDINFLHCVEEEYLAFKEPKESLVYLYWQLQAMIRTLTKSMECNQKEMQESIHKYHEQIRAMKEGATNANNN